jgi:hypothetical protein
MIFLIPEESTQRDMLFSKYLQDLPGDHTELGAAFGSPVGGVARLALMRSDHRCSDHYLFVMTKGAEEDLKHCDGGVVEVRILPEDADQMLDFQKDFHIENKKRYDA